MRRWCLVGLVLTVLAARSAAFAQGRPFTADDLVRMDRVVAASLSPDGRRLAYVVRVYQGPPNRVANAIWVRDLAQADAAPRKLVEEGAGVGSPTWSADGAQLFFLASHGGGRQVWREAWGGGAPLQVTHLPVDVGTFRLSRDERLLVVSADVYPDCPTLQCTRERLDAAKGRSANVTYRDVGVRFNDLWEDDLRNGLFAVPLGPDGTAGEAAPLTLHHVADAPSKPGGDESAYDIAPDGRSVVFSARLSGQSPSSTPALHLFRAMPGAEPVRMDPADAAGSSTQPTFSPDGRYLAYLHQAVALSDGGDSFIVVRDLITGQDRELAKTLDRSLQDLAWRDDGRALLAVADDGGRQRLFEIDVRSGAARALTESGTASHPQAEAGRLIYLADDFGHPTQVVLRDKAGATTGLTQVGAEQLAGVEMAPHESFSFVGWNGEAVQGFVVPPLHMASGRKYPVVFVIHGGPNGVYNDAWAYLRNPQVWAGRGYATVFINFHGSTGFGQAFAQSIQGHWGDRPLEDLQKGWAAALARYPYLDSGRACALGSSYGGYMVDWIAGVWNGPWRCLISHAGVFDTRAGSLSGDLVWYKEVQFAGSPIKDPEAFERFNPRNHIGDWKKPILFTHGGRDLRVTVNDSVSAFIGAQRLGIPSEFLYLPDSNHLVTRPQDTLDWYASVNAWLDRWTK